MMNPETTLEKANALMDRELNRGPRDPRVDAEIVAQFTKALIDQKDFPSDLIKDVVIAYVMKL